MASSFIGGSPQWSPSQIRVTYVDGSSTARSPRLSRAHHHLDHGGLGVAREDVVRTLGHDQAVAADQRRGAGRAAIGAGSSRGSLLRRRRVSVVSSWPSREYWVGLFFCGKLRCPAALLRNETETTRASPASASSAVAEPHRGHQHRCGHQQHRAAHGLGERGDRVGEGAGGDDLEPVVVGQPVERPGRPRGHQHALAVGGLEQPRDGRQPGVDVGADPGEGGVGARAVRRLELLLSQGTRHASASRRRPRCRPRRSRWASSPAPRGCR